MGVTPRVGSVKKSKYHQHNDDQQDPAVTHAATGSLALAAAADTEASDLKGHSKRLFTMPSVMSSTKLMVLLILCLQNSFFTVLRRYSQGVRKEIYSKYEVLLFGEAVKLVFSAYMVSSALSPGEKAAPRIAYLARKSSKMAVLALIYGLMNILSFVALRNIGAGIFTIFAQLKILTTATCSTVMLHRSYSWARWRALVGLMLGVLLFSEPVWNRDDANANAEGGNAVLGTVAVLIEVTLSGFASIYFEKVIKMDAEQLGVWERNFQLALGSFPIYVGFILYEHGGEAGFGGGWSLLAFALACLGAAGGLLVALSIKHGDSILKTLATTGAIILSSILDHYWLGGPLTPTMCIAGAQVVISICNYTFDETPVKQVTTEKTPTPEQSRASSAMSDEMKSLKHAEEGVDNKEVEKDMKE